MITLKASLCEGWLMHSPRPGVRKRYLKHRLTGSWFSITISLFRVVPYTIRGEGLQARLWNKTAVA
jgi:hypothetical protein